MYNKIISEGSRLLEMSAWTSCQCILTYMCFKRVILLTWLLLQPSCNWKAFWGHLWGGHSDKLHPAARRQMLPPADGAFNGKPCGRNNLACSPWWFREQHLPIADYTSPHLVLSLCSIEKGPSACALFVGSQFWRWDIIMWYCQRYNKAVLPMYGWW
jgi:hypothetical protein